MKRVVPLLVLVAGPALAAGPAPDRIFVNARIWTGDPARPRAQALAVRGDRIAAVGTNADVRRLADGATAVVDLGGRFVAPGFNDAHLHLLHLETVDLGGARSVEEIQARIADYARTHPERAWITGRGWSYGAFPGGLPHRALLDAVVSDRPAWLTGYDGHTGWANTRAMAVAGITRDTPDPEAGEIVRDAAGEATGVLKEDAMDLVRRHLPPPADEERYRALKLRLDQAVSYGLTSVQNASPIDLAVYERVMAEDALKVRVYAALPFKKDPTEGDLAEYRALRDKYRGPLLKFGAVKGMVDGVVESRTAAMFEPYSEGGGTGTALWTAEELGRTAAAYDAAGFQIFLHAIGDRGIHMALNAFEHAARANGSRGRRHRVEHIEVPRPEDVARFGPLGVVASTQALFASPDQNTFAAYVPALGPERAARAMPFRAIDDAGAVQAFGSDWPVFSMEALKGIYCAVTRMTPAGTPPGGWQPQHRISPEAALRHFTVDAAYASFDDDVKGSLSPGKLADFVVLSEDILEPPPERILRTEVLLTVMGGRETYRSPELR